MSVETEYRALLTGYGPLAALVSGRVAQDSVPDDSAYPLVVFAAAHDYDRGLDNTLLGHTCTLTTQCWARGTSAASAAGAVADQVAAAVATAPAYAVLDRATISDPEAGLDGVSLTVQWML